MALPDQRQLQTINEIAEALCDVERRRLLFLCESLDTDNSVGSLKAMLKSKVMCYERGDLFLKELMLQLRRFDILRKVFKTSKEELERNLTCRQVLPRFRILMANIGEDLVNEDLDNVKFLLTSTLPREKVEKSKNFLDVIIELEKLDIVSPERVDFVENCLQNIGRLDLAKKVTAYKMSVVTSEQHSSQQQKCRAPRPFPPSNSCHPLQQTRRGQSPHSATGIIPAPVYREQNCQSHLDCYKFNTNPRGVCVIIDCVGNDGDMLEQTFKALHFNVFLYKWLSVGDIFSALEWILRQRENREGDGFVCCIISRGMSNHVLGTDSYGAGLSLNSVRSLVTAEACPMLAGKPKLFFIQRYSVPEFQPCARMHHRDEDLETDGFDGLLRCEIIPTDADVFWSHCWTDECQLEQGHHRSIYLKALTDALHKGQRRKTHLVAVHTEVNGAIFEHNKRNPGANYHIDLKHTLRKDLYLQ
ncbi:CASP8 and FADD-like apoptosis regulator isoform X1 [Siniperca chuatsi]|uniref:CASP8 and FADD-like apoptosis regulator isoform X1 n=1 Tax=Siniperca chuatsi TaxID=119488 RepID=UPI001CE04311|nr:CASP8 and FADD-like apoptosis regulator isoform X1 [Siniperca chuatsi]XP_044072302.1 CASP8 and FADD-like apoptosis regulator isoform X1 [Siniperca chuatsi]